jgi:hypothetical protein
MAGSLGRGGRAEVDRVQLLWLIGFPRDRLSFCRLCGGWGHGDRIDKRHLGGCRGRRRGFVGLELSKHGIGSGGGTGHR